MPEHQTEANEHKGPHDDHDKATTVIVNGREKEVRTKELAFEQVVALAFETPPTGENVVITVTYRRGHGDKPEGSLAPGKSVKVKEGMILNVTATDKS